MIEDIALVDLRRELSELIERSAYARMLVAQALAECLDEDDLRGFYDASREYECKQQCRWLMRAGVPCDEIERVKARDMRLITDSCDHYGSRIIFIRRPKRGKANGGNGNNGNGGGGV